MSTTDSQRPVGLTTWDRELRCAPFGRPSVSLDSQGNSNGCSRTHSSNVLAGKVFRVLEECKQQRNGISGAGDGNRTNPNEPNKGVTTRSEVQLESNGVKQRQIARSRARMRRKIAAWQKVYN